MEIELTVALGQLPSSHDITNLPIISADKFSIDFFHSRLSRKNIKDRYLATFIAFHGFVLIYLCKEI
jgi:hypothetical protein